MLVNLIHDTPGERRRLMVAGVAFIVSIALMIWLSIALYNKQFTNTTEVTVMADRTGQQLAKFGDVRLHGALVGNIKSIKSDGRKAEITLSLRPEAARKIPADVSVQIVPTTLFGRKYLELVPPEGGSAVGGAKLKDGSVIPASRVTTNVELQAIMANLFPLLRSIRPADLNSTLYAIAHALEGKGDQLGDTFEALDDYLIRVNPKLPTLKTDLALLADVAQTYELAAPDIIRLLGNATVTARTITDNQGSLDRALGSLTGLARTTRVTLSENEQALIDQVRSGRPLLALLDTYSPELPCLLEGIDLQRANTKNVFQNDMIHQTLELGAPQRTGYTAADAPEFGEVGHGPWCLGLPANYPIPAPFQPLKDGTDKDEPDGGARVKTRDKTFTIAAVKLGIFTVVSLMVTAMLVAIMGGFGLGSQTEYKAVFSTASELTKGDDVRIAGVVVGKVTDVKIYRRDQALVTFKVKDAVPLTNDSRASIRFLNLIGERYMSLTEGAAGASRLKANSTLPIDRTTPALNLTELFQGFQPLFQALRPEDVNKLSLNLIQVLQGEGGTVQELLSNTASLTNTLADRDQLIGDVITNLSTLMATVDEHHQELDELITSMRSWFGNLAEDREIIGSSLTNISTLTETVADLLTRGRPLLKEDVAQLRRLFTLLAKPENKEYLDETLDKLPTMLAKQTRIGVYGSWYNYYMCEFQGGIVLPSPLMDALPADVQTQISDFTMYSSASRCQ